MVVAGSQSVAGGVVDLNANDSDHAWGGKVLCKLTGDVQSGMARWVAGNDGDYFFGGGDVVKMAAGMVLMMTWTYLVQAQTDHDEF